MLPLTLRITMNIYLIQFVRQINLSKQSLAFSQSKLSRLTQITSNVQAKVLDFNSG